MASFGLRVVTAGRLRYPPTRTRVRSVISRLAPVLAIPLLLGAGCAVTHSGVTIDYVDFVQFGGITYLAAWTSADRPLQGSDLGGVFGTVKVKLAGSQDPAHQLQDGDAADLAPGTQVHRVRGYRPTFRLAARRDGRLVLYEADTNPKAKVGADLLDLAGKVRYIGVNSMSDGHTELAAIRDPGVVLSLIDLVDRAAVDQSKQPTGAPQYVIDFHMLDGTEVIRSYWPDSGELSRGIHVPDAFRLALGAVPG